jgi:hypothetical protein
MVMNMRSHSLIFPYGAKQPILLLAPCGLCVYKPCVSNTHPQSFHMNKRKGNYSSDRRGNQQEWEGNCIHLQSWETKWIKSKILKYKAEKNMGKHSISWCNKVF